jgi:NADH-quinone oxidoreductase subunit H
MYLLQIDWWIFFEKLILVAVIVTTALIVAMYSTYAERKIAAFLQDRRGPNRAGPFGLLQFPAHYLFLLVQLYLSTYRHLKDFA